MDELDRVVRDFVAAQPYSVAIEPTDTPNRTLSRFHIKQTPPTLISVVVADIVNNLRAALDNLAYAMAERNLGRPLTPEEQRLPAFPILDSESEFNRYVRARGRDRLWGKRGVGALRVVQPFTDPNTVAYHSTNPFARLLSRSDLLRRMNNLWNVDKHRHLTVAAFVPNGISWPYEEGSESPRFSSGDGLFADGSVLYYIEGGADLPIGIHFDLTIVDDLPLRRTGLGHGDHVVQLMHKFHAYVTDCVFPAVAQTWTDAQSGSE
ncbi:hypothetical protein [Luedemannella helvata]|uniref:TIGR04255 family protein n=1 Tax=Luedemannella helvata TaxID=349315 RepID=A0ABN2KJD4_9ACTN